MKATLYVGYLLVFLSGFTQAQEGKNRIFRDFVSKAVVKGGEAGLAVTDLATGKALMSEGSELLLAPASTLKTITTATALELLGPGYRFSTLVGYSGKLDPVSGVLKGNLVVKGGGDPVLGSKLSGVSGSPDTLAALVADSLGRKGIKTVTGDLVLDVSSYEPWSVPGSWAWEDLGNYYGAAPSALTFADNMISLYFDSPSKSGEPVTLVRMVPDLPWLSWQNELKSSSVNRDLAYVYGSPWGEKRLIRGTIPAGRKGFEVKASLPEPPLFLGHFMKEKLAGAGIQVKGDVRIVCENQEFNNVCTLMSLPLSEIIREINHESVNLYSEHLVMQLALEKSGKGSMQEGLKVIEEFWKEKGVDGPVFMEDGSGLSRFNAVTPQYLVQVLIQMYRSKNGSLFKASLPSAGNGTLGGFRQDDFPGETLRSKSGSMERVRGYAGYLRCVSGREVVFALLVNNFPGTSQEVQREIKELLKKIRNSY